MSRFHEAISVILGRYQSVSRLVMGYGGSLNGSVVMHFDINSISTTNRRRAIIYSSGCD